uniref:Uncharacterized protein n=1 Tax=Glossina morsitans morsitans TaxID=37546 RepID=A0A1B0F9M6_GLOMM
MIGRLEFIHSKWFTHRDVKSSLSSIVLDRFWFSQKVVEKFKSTARYASFIAHLGIELSRRDDMESLGYVMMYFIHGMSPWRKLKSDKKQQKYEKVLERKMSTAITSLF